jgi:hypothetical protein
MTQPAVTTFLLGQLHALGEEAGRVARLAAARDEAGLARTVGRLRHRLAAHVRVEERLFVSSLRDSRAYRDLLGLENEHDLLVHRAAEVEAAGCRPAEVAALSRVLRAHIDEERRVVRLASWAARDRLAAIPPWRAPEVFECAGGPTDTWPGEWLG